MRVQIQENTRVGTCYLDTELRYIEVNEWLAGINGVPRENHIGRTIAEIIPGDTRMLRKQLRRVIETGKPILGGLVRIETAAHPGVKRLYQHDFTADRAEDGSVKGVRCIVRDITQQQIVEMDGVIPWEADART